ncbi:uncharacterized protein LOC115065789 [Bactrocera dorsalis]|uniref:Uncharacterized protein LOC115065789 n=1 Tax=Bactrocera dorsalis TaxID=27457 RepID=A0A8N4KXQ3_BACDO|nr:uncharacterized protein LOC115065789 [Bactrocera dorsalis]
MNMYYFALKCIFTMIVLVTPSSTETLKPNFTQLNCIVLDKSFLAFEVCSLDSKSVVNIRLKLLKRPLDNIMLQGMIMKYTNGSYQNYYFNNLYDICKIMRSKRNVFVQFVYQLAMPYTNFNHTCPFNEPYMFVKNFPLDDIALHPLRMLTKGKYALIGTWMSNRIKRMNIELYLTMQN